MAELVDGVRSGDRARLGQAITLVESVLAEHRNQAQELLTALLSDDATKPGAHRIAITGVPGVGKSTFIESFGARLVELGHRVAVLAVDPTSVRTGGSIMGDKTRMADLGNDPRAFVRPSPTSGQLGGVQARTRETISLCEAAGFDIVLVETVGVGQSETAVADMVDFFLVLMLPGAGDDLQGMKKGILELADLIAVNKADEPDTDRAEQTATSYRRALHLTAPASPTWSCPVLTCSALTGAGLDDVAAEIERHRSVMSESGELAQRRQAQLVRWMHDLLATELRARVDAHPRVREMLADLEADVAAAQITPAAAVSQLLEAFGKPVS